MTIATYIGAAFIDIQMHVARWECYPDAGIPEPLRNRLHHSQRGEGFQACCIVVLHTLSWCKIGLTGNLIGAMAHFNFYNLMIIKG